MSSKIDYFDYLEKQSDRTVSGDNYDEELDKGHGRLEIRRDHVVQDIEWLEGKEQWKGLGRLINIHSTTEYLLNGRISEDTRYYISSLSKTALERSVLVRAHWQIENKLHWV